MKGAPRVAPVLEEMLSPLTTSDDTTIATSPVAFGASSGASALPRDHPVWPHDVIETPVRRETTHALPRLCRLSPILSAHRSLTLAIGRVRVDAAGSYRLG